MRIARRNTRSVSRQATGVTMVLSETNDRRICVLNMLKQEDRETDRQKKGKIQFTATTDLVMAVY